MFISSKITHFKSGSMDKVSFAFPKGLIKQQQHSVGHFFGFSKDNMKRQHVEECFEGKRHTSMAGSNVPTHEVPRCVRSGASHQGDDALFLGRNAQCTAMSVCSAIYSSINLRDYKSYNIDAVLAYGDQLYMHVFSIANLPENETHLNIFDLPSEFRVGEYLAKIERFEGSYSHGLFPESPSDRDSKINALINNINSLFGDDFREETDSVIFTGQWYTFSFWRYRHSYFLFNSHAVDSFNNTAADGVARLFKIRSIRYLAEYLFKHASFTSHIMHAQYTITKLRLINYIAPSPTFTQSSSELAFIASSEPPSRISSPFSDIASDMIEKPHDSKLTVLNPVVLVEKFYDHKLELLDPVVVVHNIFSKLSLDDYDTASSVKKGRPIKQKRGRKATKENAHLDAVKKYATQNVDLLRAAKKEYAKKHLDVNRQAVRTYTQNKPDVHKQAVHTYTQTHPDVHRQAVHTYTQKHPDVNRQAVRTYTQTHPDVHRTAVRTYTQQHPEVHSAADARYREISRNADPPLRRSSNLIGEKVGAELDLIRPFTLKNPSLLAPSVYRCPKCSARLFIEEKSRKTWCCSEGAAKVLTLPDCSEEFYSHPAFIKTPRGYNNLFAFSALGVSHGYQNPTTGISFVKIQGRVYHRIYNLSDPNPQNTLGLYISDDTERERIALGRNLDVQVVRCITNYLHNVNPLIECFKRLSQEPSNEAFIRFERTTRETHGNILGDVPIGAEVAAIISTDTETYVPRSIAVWKIGESRPRTIDIMDQMYEPLQYPLLYQNGNPGWYPGKLGNNNKKLSQLRYIRCLLLSEPRFSEFTRLSEEWLVDMYCRISEERLRFIANMQHRNNNALRIAPLPEVNQVNNDETIQGEGFVPGRIYLPNSFTGGPRYMKVKYMDAISIVNRLGTPTYLLTFTCNPKWPEVKESTTPPFPNPLVCARVFQLRLQELLRDIRSGLWFGKLLYMIHVIEFQKRGLPHAHVCFKVENGPTSNIDIDKFVRADIPDASEAAGRLRSAVLNHMIHGPCGPPHRTDLLCWDSEKRQCRKYFPKRETDVTFVDSKGFVNFRRSKGNVATIKYRNRDVAVDDRWVVPYNSALLLKYDAHINLEVSSQRQIVKYLFKYMTKGPDQSRVAVIPEDQLNNEVEQYVTKRYIGSSDAAWRTLEFDVTAREPNVKQLTVHLEGQQSVFFRVGTEAESAQRATSDLITYFCRPAGDVFDSLTYLDFYEQYLIHASRPSTKNVTIYDTSNHKFVTKRQRGEMVARLFWVAPNRGEQFYLRILLKSYPCRNYGDLFKLGGPNCVTFQEAAKTVGLANDELEYETAMLEASTFFTGPRLRRFFVLLACNGAPVAGLWDRFRDQLSEDFIHRLHQQNDAMAHSMALVEINRMLSRHGTSITQHGLPSVTDHTTELGRERVEHNSDRLTAYVATWLPRLSSDQRVVFDYVEALCVDKFYRDTLNSAIFVDGPAGTGKTLLLNVVAAHVRGTLKGVALCTASSAIAAQNYEGGITAHSMFRLPIDLVDDLGHWNITNGSQRVELIAKAQIIIYDEAPMAHKFLIHLLDRSLRDLMQNDLIFGGKIIIFAGDFRQIPPVVENARNNSEILNSSLKTSFLWHRIESFALVTSQRCREDLEYADFLLKLGSNSIPLLEPENLVDLSCLSFVTELDNLIDFVFSRDIIADDPDECARRAILSTRNDSVAEINSVVLGNLPGDIIHLFSADKIETDGADQVFFGIDSLNRAQPKGVPEHDLKLKIGCVCMIIRNLSFADGLVNGTKVIVVGASPRLVTVRKPGGSEDFLIPRIIFKAPMEPRSPFEMTRRQFPLQLSYAMTIHKSQGQTISRVGVDLRSDIFSHGQLYVALGRVRERNNITLLVHRDRIINGVPYARNLVISELLF